MPATNGCTDKLCVYFSGLDVRLKEDEYHLQVPAVAAGYESLFLKDKSRRWFHTRNTEQISEYLCELVKNYKGRVIFLGTSLGGYAAIMFGLKAMPAKIIAFSPQTSTKFHPRSLCSEYDAAQQWPTLEIHRCEIQTDLIEMWNDKFHAEAMGNYAKVITHPCTIHSCAQALHESGKLQEIIHNS